MPFPDGLNVDLELRHDATSGQISKHRGCRILRDKQHPVGRVNLERNAEAAQHARLRRGAFASRKLSQIGRREYQLLFSNANSNFVGEEPRIAQRREAALQKRNSRQSRESRASPLGSFTLDAAKGLVTRVVAREKEKGPRSLRTEGLAA
jgi:hypothetical protein